MTSKKEPSSKIDNFWVEHPNYGWTEVDCACTAVDVSSFLRDLGQKPWRIALGNAQTIRKGQIMVAFHGDPAIKEKYIARIKAHMAADELVQREGWRNGKGCAVGCTLDAYDHSRYPIELGLPEWLAHLEDAIFEGLSPEKAMTWPLRFLEAINVGAEIKESRISILRMERLIVLQEQNLAKNPEKGSVIREVIAAIVGVRKALITGVGLDFARSAAESASESAAESEVWSESAWSAARSAARSEVWSEAWSEAWSEEADAVLLCLSEAK